MPTFETDPLQSGLAETADALEAARRLPASDPGQDDQLVDARVLSKLRWRCRRGLLENDLFIERYFERFEATLTVRQARGMDLLMDLSDNDLLDLLLRRKEPDADALAAESLEVLAHLRPPLQSASAQATPVPSDAR